MLDDNIFIVKAVKVTGREAEAKKPCDSLGDAVEKASHWSENPSFDRVWIEEQWAPAPYLKPDGTVVTQRYQPFKTHLLT